MNGMKCSLKLALVKTVSGAGATFNATLLFHEPAGSGDLALHCAGLRAGLAVHVGCG